VEFHPKAYFVDLPIELTAKKVQSRPQDEGTQALATHARKGKGQRNFGKKNTGGGSAPVEEHKKKNLSKIKCFNCNAFGHYAS